MTRWRHVIRSLRILMWGPPQQELPLPLPLAYGLPAARSIPQLRRVSRREVPFIGGAYAFWCQKCWGTLDIRTAGRNPDCPQCHRPIMYVATVMAGAEQGKE
jgi:hypothetical protein